MAWGQTATVSPASVEGEDHTLRAMMELARREPIVENGLKGQASYRLYPAPVMTGRHQVVLAQPAGGWYRLSVLPGMGGEVLVVSPYGPDNASEFVCERNGGFVVTSRSFNTKGPCTKRIG